MRIASLTCVCALFLGFSAHARPLSAEEKRADFEQLASLIKSQYGPYEFKVQSLKLDLDKLVDQYAAEAATVSNIGFYHLINRFVAEFKDSHFRTRVQTDYVATLGFIADRIDGKVLIDQISRTHLPEWAFDFQRGDEIVSIDGKPAHQVVEGLAKYIGMGNPEAALRMAAVMIGHRPAAMLPPVSGLAEVAIRRGTSSIIEKVRLPWHEAGDLLEDVDASPTWAAAPPRYEQLSVADVFADIPQGEQAFRCSGMTRTAPPKGTTVLMTKPFVAYFHPTPKGNIGYLRIPHYSWEDQSELRLQQYEYVVSQLEKYTDALIIDQDHNCGGSVFFLEKMVALFADKPYQGLEFKFLASRAEYLDFKNWVDSENRFTLMGADWVGVTALVKNAWLSRSRMSPKVTFHNNRMLHPNAIRYTKPIVMLIDELSGSGGDAFPAIMQGMKRAKLMGKRTMGAGGHVVSVPALNYSSNTLSITKSLFFRPDGVEVENNGVVPDIKYEPTRDDFLYQYRNYQARYLDEVQKLIP